MSGSQAESVIKNIIREIARECTTKGQAVSETLVAFMVKAIVLNPHSGFNVDRTLTKEDVQTLIKMCVTRILDTKSPSLETIKMQVYFDMNYTSRDVFLEEHRRVLESRLHPVIREITDSRAQTREDIETLYRKIVTSVLLRSGLGSPTDISVVREATASLHSIFPHTELSTFMSLPKKDKERQLLELTMICTGIRLFNKESSKGGEGIDDLPAILNAAVPQTSQNINESIKAILVLIDKYTAILENVLMVKKDTINADVLELLKKSQFNVRQLEVYLRIILNDVISCARLVEAHEKQLKDRLEQLQNTVQAKAAVPTAQVYPQFIHLSQLWSGLQDEMVFLSVLSNISANLSTFSKVHKELFSGESFYQMLSGLTIKSDQQRMDDNIETIEKSMVSECADLQWLFPESTSNFSKLIIEFRGFCGVTLSVSDGLLLLGNPNIGVAKYKECYYTFASKEAGLAFAKDPEKFIICVGEIAKYHPELIQLLQLQNQFSTITPQGKTSIGSHQKVTIKCDSGTQTDTHFMESNIVKSYEWNEWELRRKAIKLANLRQKLTHSTQSNRSNFRRDSATQVYLPKTKEVQTKSEHYSNIPKPQVYIAGLRGCKTGEPTKMEKIDLTLHVANK